ncbi:hypothetical protein Taro_000133 [Colocasia esculenta]|uniref:Uncharacterized protein n=1 Tax=Colocasia esculenta TaxID=4460 RepID=A0A843T9Z1_COLES|nr:hypothetical protein [Colocasia esculenta]
MDKPTSTPLMRWIFLALDGELKQKIGEPSSSCSWLRTDQTPEEVNVEFFQDLVDDVELIAHTGVDESKEPICLSKGNEVEEVDPHEIKGTSGRRTDIDVGQVSSEDSDEEEEYTSDECEDDDEDGAELDISSSSEEKMDII